ncbi:hypothetical protein [Streptomyces gardneri]|uniref:hypothetical protein n=1 Tax=Streptomyces gardneri TaxID=66892 RepID=UPI0033EC5059
MRKRASRPNRFAAVENTAIDALPSILATGLLTKLIRARDGDEVTVEGLCKTHVEGREALTKAMRMLVEKAFVVKFKIQRAASEMVEEDGQLVAKRGGSWYTTFNVDSFAFTAEDVAAMLAETYDGGNVKSHRIEPEHLDPRKNGIDWTRPGAGNPSVGATSNNAKPWPEGDLRPTYGLPTVGPPTVGHPAADIRKKTVLSKTEREDEMPLSGRGPTGCRQASTGSKGLGEGALAAPATSKPRLSKQQRDQVKAVRALLPRELDTVLGDRLPANVSLAVVDALATDRPRERTVQQLVEHRVLPRWNGYWASKFFAGELPAQPYGPLVSMLKDTAECGNIACDDRADIHTGEPCTACATRAQDQRASRETPKDHSPVPEEPPVFAAQRERVVVDHSVGLRHECGDCGRPFPPGTNETLCAQCRPSAAPAPF